MKNTIIALAMAVGLAACAANGPAAGDGTVASASTDGEVKRKRVCNYEKTTTGSRLERVCRYVEVSE